MRWSPPRSPVPGRSPTRPRRPSYLRLVDPDVPAHPAAGWATLALYTVTMFLSASLLFVVQPLYTRLVLPLLGGSPAVWNTALVFFQVALLAGYGYAHVVSTRLRPTLQLALHGALLCAPLLVLPIALPAGWTPPTTANPVPWLLLLLTVTVGLPFVVVSTTSPLLQAWFARTGHRAAHDPYFLYAASNIGSLLALAAYPALIEPRLRLGEQTSAWAVGYGALVVLVLACGWRARTGVAGGATTPVMPTETLTLERRLRWVLLAAVPSSLLLSATTYLTTNIAPIPLFWAATLALYLLTFILAFSKRSPLPPTLVLRALPVLVLPLVVMMVTKVNNPIELPIAVHLLTLFVAALACHGALAADRPAAGRLTEFYLWLSVGGALGGGFNALLAPVIFHGIAEYPLALVALCLLVGPVAERAPRRLVGRRWDVAVPLAIGLLLAGGMLGAKAAGLPATPASRALIFALPVLLCFGASRQRWRFGLGIGALLLVGSFYDVGQGRVLHAERSFYGVHRVRLTPDGGYHTLAHGDTVHGVQSLDPARRREPLAYYHRNGPVGHLFSALDARSPGPRRIGAVGLGAGAVSCYARSGDTLTFFEIDPAVERIARDPRYFSFLADCAPATRVVLGDARLTLAASDERFDLLILDAFSSDSVPVHLLTREALAVYQQRLAPGGVLAFHISNRYLDLRPVLAAGAADAGLVGWYESDDNLTAEEVAGGKFPSLWVALARQPEQLGALTADQRWTALATVATDQPWTDDFSSVLRVWGRGH